jgi:CheY-like chemotaxis protein
MASQVCRILAVDDLPDNLFLLQTILEAEGYEVDVAEHGRVALAKIQALPPDLVLLDVMMPDLNGLEVTRAIRQDKNLRALPIVLITAHEDTIMTQGLDAGANDFIRKPIDFEHLLATIRAFVAKA